MRGSGPASAVEFLREFVKSPTTTAAVGPSSRYLAEQMVAPIPGKGDPVVVELGPGTGSFTEAIQRRLGGRGRHLALELNQRWAAALGERFPEVETLCADARELPVGPPRSYADHHGPDGVRGEVGGERLRRE